MFTDRYYQLDGGLSSALENDGWRVDDDPLWTARLLYTNPLAIKKAHSSFLLAGAELIVSATYQASIEGFQRHLGTSPSQSEALMALAGRLVVEAVEEEEERRRRKGESGSKLTPVGSLGPYGTLLADGSEYTGKYIDKFDLEVIKDFHRRRISAIRKSGLDIVAVETLPAQKEAIGILDVMKEFPGMKCWVSFACKDSHHTCYGDDFGQAVEGVYRRGGDQVVAVGVNCSSPPLITPLLQKAGRHLPPPEVLPRVVYPNSGEEWIPGRGWKTNPRASLSPLLGELEVWGGLGARVLGGCCRVGPEDIRVINRAIKSLPHP